MRNVIEFRLRENPKRHHVIQWLSQHVGKFPEMSGVGPKLFYRWGFIRASDGIIYFADCIHPGITEQEMNDFKSLALGNVEVMGK